MTPLPTWHCSVTVAAGGRNVDNDAASADRRIRTSFARQGLMRTLGATLSKVTSGQVEIVLVPKPEVSQQHGFVHAGAVSAIADSAAGYAALSMMPMDRGVLTTEFKINLLAPAMGERIVARGRVVKAGRTLTLAACAFVIWVIIVTALGHPFWTMEGAARAANQANFYKNLAIMAAYLLLAITGAGRYSLDHRPAAASSRASATSA